MKRKGIALLITIALVATITALLTVSTGILDNSFKRISNKLFLIQSNIFFNDFITILNDATNDVNDSDTLDIFLMLPVAFASEHKDIAVDISFVSDASKININNIVEDSNSSKKRDPYEPIPLVRAYESYVEHILSIYNVSDKILLLSMIADTVDDDLDERIPGSEIALADPLFSQGSIYSVKHMEQIVEAYVRESRDYNAQQVPWKDLFGFRNTAVDFNHISQDVLYHVAPELQESLDYYTTEREEVYDSYDGIPLNAETKVQLDTLGIDFYSPEVRGSMNISSSDYSVEIEFSYNLKTKEVSHIEITN
ncbi:MAG: hypothetical protein U9P71_06350 [Campylobacterota bacterium]|nr:hypothetical protein [Campylobacterota bacterium]